MFKKNDLVYVKAVGEDTLKMSSGGSEIGKRDACSQKTLCRIREIDSVGPYLVKEGGGALGYVAMCDLRSSKNKPTVII